MALGRLGSRGGYGRLGSRKTSSSLTSVDVVFAFGDSQIAGARNVKTELPANYYTTDTNTFIWDKFTTNTIVTLVPGYLESQPNPLIIDPAFTNTIGGAGEFIKHYRIDNPSRPLYFFTHQMGGGRFSDAASNGRTVNYLTSLNDGAYNSLKVSWNAFVAALLAQGKTPNVILAWTGLGYNTALDATESSNYQTDMTSLIAGIRTNCIGSAKLVIARLSNQSTAVAGANANTVRAAQQAIAVADSTRVELMNTDGAPSEAVDNLHFTAAAFQIQGEQLYYHAANLWYPQKEFAYNGGNPVSHEYRPGDLRNSFVASAVSSVWDCAGANFTQTQGTAGSRPVQANTTLANGYPAQYATADGVDDYVVSATGRYLMDGSWGLFSAFSAPAVNNATVFCEGSNVSATPFMAVFRSDASGFPQFLYRDDASNVTGPTPLLNTAAFNNTMNFVAAWDNTTQLRGQVNGTLGSNIAYTRNTATTNQTSIYAVIISGATLAFSGAKVGIVWATDAIPDSTYLANARAFCQRRFGTV